MSTSHTLSKDVWKTIKFDTPGCINSYSCVSLGIGDYTYTVSTQGIYKIHLTCTLVVTGVTLDDQLTIQLRIIRNGDITFPLIESRNDYKATSHTSFTQTESTQVVTELLPGDTIALQVLSNVGHGTITISTDTTFSYVELLS